MRLVVCDGTGCLGLYSFDQEEGGDCSLIRQFFLIDEDTCQDIGPLSDASDLGSGSDGASSPTPGQEFCLCLWF